MSRSSSQRRWVPQRLEWLGAAARARLLQLRDGLASSGVGGWLYAVWRPFGRLALAVWELLRWALAKCGAALRWLLLPKGDTPFDVLKHFVSLILSIVGLTALLWAGKQIYNPPIVITVAKLPTPVSEEYWLNTEIARALIDQIERMRAIVKGERDPSFEAVLDPPNIVVKSGDWSFNVQEQLLVPLGSLLGRSHGEVHLALTCYHPGCLRARDSECQQPIPAPKATAGETAKAGAVQPISPGDGYLCLRLAADIRRGKVYKRVTTRLNVNNQTFKANSSREMARIAEELTALADPATAALYFYLRVKQEGGDSRVGATSSGRVSELRGDVFKAAGQAEAQDAVSACWAHSVRARMAIDRREFALAETYITRARSIPLWRHVRQLTLPMNCRRLIAVAEMAFARRLAAMAVPWQTQIYPLHPEDDNELRQQAAFKRITRIIDELGGSASSSWQARLERALAGAELTEAAKYVRAEIGLSFFPDKGLCEPLADALPLTAGHDDRIRARAAISTAIKSIEDVERGPQLRAIVRQAALDFSQRLADKRACLAEATSLAELMYRHHPDSPGAARLLARVMEQNALSEARSKDKDGETYLGRARQLYERMVDIGDDRMGVFALARLALISTAFDLSFEPDDPDLTGPDRKRILETLKQAWARFERENYPADVRQHAESVLALWGAVLLTSYSQAVVTADIDVAKNTGDAHKDEAARNKDEFLQNALVLFPGSAPKSLADLVKLNGLGPRIGCLCLLSRMAGSEANAAEFFVTNVDLWSRFYIWRSPGACSGQLLPDEAEASFKVKKIQLAKAERLCHVAESK